MLASGKPRPAQVFGRSFQFFLLRFSIESQFETKYHHDVKNKSCFNVKLRSFFHNSKPIGSKAICSEPAVAKTFGSKRATAILVFWGIFASSSLLNLLTASQALAQQRFPRSGSSNSQSNPQGSKLSWDLGGAFGTYGDFGYSEINLGLNWSLQDYLVWRNSVFTRFSSGGQSASGLDTSLRLQHSVSSQDGTYGLGFFGGPGYRISDAKYSALFGELGLRLKLGGLNIGGGVKAFSYSNPGLDRNGNQLPKTDTVMFLILSGGGSL